MRWLGEIGLRARLVILVVVAIVPLLTILVAGAVADRQLSLMNARARAVELARLGAERQAVRFREAQEMLRSLRRIINLESLDRAACHELLRTLVADHPQFNTIGVEAEDSSIVCHSALGPKVRQAFTENDLLQQALAPDAPAFVVGKYIIGRISGKRTVIVATALPRAADGFARGMVFTSLNLEFFGRTIADLNTEEGSCVLVIDPRTGTVLADRSLESERIGQAFPEHALVRAMTQAPEGGILDTVGFDGTPRLFGFAPIPGAGNGGAMMLVGLSRSAVLADANWRLFVGLAVALLVTTGALGGAWLFSEGSLARPIRDLVETAKKLGEGELAARCAVHPRLAPEFRALGATLNGMAGAIGAAQQELRDSEAQLRLLTENASDMIFKLDRNFRRTYVSPASREILGFGPAELIWKKPSSLIHPEDADHVLQTYRDLLSGLERATVVDRARHRLGHWVWVETRMRALRDPLSGEVTGIVASLRDISARKATEDAVQASEALFRGVFDHTTDSILVISVGEAGALNIEIYNKAAAVAMNVPIGGANGKSIDEVLPPTRAAKLKAEIEQCVMAREALQFEDVGFQAEARSRWEIILVPVLDEVGAVVRVIVNARDTSERMLAEDLVRESGERYRLIADNVADMVVRLRHDLTCGFVSPASRDLLACEPEDLLAFPFLDVVHAEDRSAVFDEITRLRTGTEKLEFRFRAHHSNGAHVWVEATGRRLANADSMILAIRDVSRRKQVEDELEAANRRLNILASQDGLTGLANRRSFDETFDREWQRAVREATPLGLVIMDVDKFKAYNDIYGHQAGDNCLCAVARTIEGALLRPADFAARYGGEEFVVLLPNTDRAGTIQVAERIRRAVEAQALEHRGNPAGVVTISAGMACRASGDVWLAPREALRVADQNLYAAKSRGRNRVVSDSAPPPTVTVIRGIAG